MKNLLKLFVLIFLAACGDDDSIQVNPPSDPPVTNELIMGVNVQRAFLSSHHPGMNEEQIADRVAELINRFNFNSIRIGGTAAFGGTFDEAYGGFGWSKYNHIEQVATVHPVDHHASESYNYNVLALKTAQKAGVSVWIDLHAFMTEEDIQLVLDLVDEYELKLAGITRDNEPYIPDRAAEMEATYAILNESQFQDFAWPAMSIISEDLGDQGSRATRESLCLSLVNQYRSPDEWIEIHSYMPMEYNGTPGTWIETIIESTNQAYNIDNSQIMLGEWNGKNQETFSDVAIENLIEEYLEVLEREQVASYYQLLGSQYDEVGLYNFVNDTENRGASVFKNR